MFKEMTAEEEAASARRTLAKTINGVIVFTGDRRPARFEPVLERAYDALAREDATAEELRACSEELFRELGSAAP